MEWDSKTHDLTDAFPKKIYQIQKQNFAKMCYNVKQKLFDKNFFYRVGNPKKIIFSESLGKME